MNRELIFHDVEQGSNQWLEVKAGKFSGTDASKFLVKPKTGTLGAGLKSDIYRKADELVTGPNLDGYESPAMARGKALEPVAANRYMLENFTRLTEIGFIQMGDYFGVSPDRLVLDEGGLEIKCLEGPAFLAWLDTDKSVFDIPKPYYAQIQWALWITGRQWWDYVVFNPDYEPNDYTQTRVLPEFAAFDAFELRAAAVDKKMTDLLNRVDRGKLVA